MALRESVGHEGVCVDGWRMSLSGPHLRRRLLGSPSAISLAAELTALASATGAAAALALRAALPPKQARAYGASRLSLFVRCEHLVRAAGDDRIQAEGALTDRWLCRAEEPECRVCCEAEPRDTTFTRRDVRLLARHDPGGRLTPAAGTSLREPLLTGAELLHGPLGVLDGPGVVAEEELRRLAPAATDLYGVGNDRCLAGRLARSACGLSRC